MKVMTTSRQGLEADGLASKDLEGSRRIPAGELERFWKVLGGLGGRAMRRVVRRGIYPIGGRYGHALDMCWMPLACELP
jgi:hypothetical protein